MLNKKQIEIVEAALERFEHDGMSEAYGDEYQSLLDRLAASYDEILPYKIGTQFMTRGKHPKLCTVIDVLKTYDSKGEMVSLRYVAEHDFLGQKVKAYDVVGTTIAMGLVKDSVK